MANKTINTAAIKTEAQKRISSARNLKELEESFRRYLGRSGEINRVLKSLKDLPQKKRKNVGRSVNEAKLYLIKAFEKKSKELRAADEASRKKEWIDVTAPGRVFETGHLHPLTMVRRQVEDIFQQMGFSIVLGPEIENEWYNFDALNIPKEHPARDMWDTLWLRQSEIKNQSTQKILSARPSSQRVEGSGPNPKLQKLLLRTHMSPVQIRYMEKNNPPLRIIAPGRVFRHEATDASHEVNFYQVEGLMVDKDVSVANFKAIIEEFFQRFFVRSPQNLPGGGRIEPLKIRLRPSYFPFVEPGFEVDIGCVACLGAALRQAQGCSVCHGTSWLEMMGAGMVHPKVFEAVRLNPKEWQGFAFGMGLDRLAMMKYKIPDIRLFYAGDLRFLRQF